MTATPSVRVLVADDHRLARLGIAALLRTQPGFDLVGEAADGVEAVDKYRALRPDVLVVDLKMPRLDGVHVTSAILREDPNARILVLSHYDDEESVFRALKAGARGYLTKDISGEELLEAVRTLHAGGSHLPSALAVRAVERAGRAALSARELEVVRLLAKGLTNRQIGIDLGISERTVGVHVSHILDKLGAATRTEAIAIATERGLLSR